jgi:hypothetical protein
MITVYQKLGYFLKRVLIIFSYSINVLFLVQDNFHEDISLHLSNKMQETII